MFIVTGRGAMVVAVAEQCIHRGCGTTVVVVAELHVFVMVVELRSSWSLSRVVVEPRSTWALSGCVERTPEELGTLCHSHPEGMPGGHDDIIIAERSS